MPKQGNLMLDGSVVIPNTTTAAVADAARQQALSASLTALVEKGALGYPTFSTLTAYAEGDTVFYDRRLYTFTSEHTPGDWDATQVQEADVKTLLTNAATTLVAAAVAGLTERIESGDLVAALAGNLDSWEGTAINAEYTQTRYVDTTGGDLSIDSSIAANLMSLAAKTDFAATGLVATGFNLLRHATAVGSGWAIMVPALPFGRFGTADEPNGLLFTDKGFVNLRPTVYFKPLSEGAPTSVTDGTACTYTDATDPSTSKQYRFYTCSEPGYMIVSGINRADVCAHIGWSRRYDEYIAVDDDADAGATVDLAAGIHALHDFDQMLTVGSVSDRIERTGENEVTWHRLVQRVKPTWTNTALEDSDGTATGSYLHSAVISGMKSGSVAQFLSADITLSTDGTTISYTDNEATASTDYVKYELATEVTGTAAVSSTFAVEDWGLIMVTGATGEAYLSIAYAQGIPDSLRGLLSQLDNKSMPVIAEALVRLSEEIAGLRSALTGGYGERGNICVERCDAMEHYELGVPQRLLSSTAGAPSSANVPKNWDDNTMGVWNGTPRFVGQRYYDQSSKKVYEAVTVTNSTADWVVLN